MILWLWEKLKTCPLQLLWLLYWEVKFLHCENYFVGLRGLHGEPNLVLRLDVIHLLHACIRGKMCMGNFACCSSIEWIIRLIFLYFGNIKCEMFLPKNNKCEMLIRLAEVTLAMGTESSTTSSLLCMISYLVLQSCIFPSVFSAHVFYFYFSLIRKGLKLTT